MLVVHRSVRPVFVIWHLQVSPLIVKACSMTMPLFVNLVWLIMPPVKRAPETKALETKRKMMKLCKMRAAPQSERLSKELVTTFLYSANDARQQIARRQFLMLSVRPVRHALIYLQSAISASLFFVTCTNRHKPFSAST